MSDDRNPFESYAGRKLREFAAMLGDDVHLTLVARFPQHPHRDMIITYENDAAGVILAVESIQRRLKVWTRGDE